MKRIAIKVNGMSCSGCEFKLENKLKKLDGVKSIKASFVDSNLDIEYDENVISLDKINETIKSIGYEVAQVSKNNVSLLQFIGILVIVIAVYTIINNTVGFNLIPEVKEGMGYGLLFLVGVMTSVHCIGMCGGINLSQCVSHKSDSKVNMKNIVPSLLYNGGRVISYTLVGAIVGALGSVISFNGKARGIIAIIAGIFMIIMGLNMMGIFPALKKFVPKMPKVFTSNNYDNKRNYGPFFVGMLNGLMPCGPLQSMQIYALGTGSALKGALSMMFFSLGTFILMFLFGAFSTFISGRFTAKMMKVSALLVIFLGVVMLGNGFSLSGFAIPNALGIFSGNKSEAKVEEDVQVITTQLKPHEYDPIVVKKGIPVKWIIQVEEKNLNGCNSEILIPEYSIDKKLKVGDNIIEFIPDKSGVVGYSCWMGMIKSNITVTE